MKELQKIFVEKGSPAYLSKLVNRKWVIWKSKMFLQDFKVGNSCMVGFVTSWWKTTAIQNVLKLEDDEQYNQRVWIHFTTLNNTYKVRVSCEDVEYK